MPLRQAQDRASIGSARDGTISGAMRLPSKHCWCGSRPSITARWTLILSLLLAHPAAIEAQGVVGHVALGRNHLAANRFAEARAAFSEAIRLAPNDADAWNGLGGALNRLEQYAEAYHAQDRAVQLNPAHGGMRFNRGLVAIELGRFQDALRDFDDVLLRRPAFAPGLTERGTALAALGDRKAASEMWERALATDSLYVWPRYYRALQAIADGRFEPAAGDLDAIIAVQPEHTGAHAWRWVAYRRSGKSAPSLPADRAAWPGAVLDFLDGGISADSLIARAHRARLSVDDRRLASALFFTAQRQLVTGDTAAALRALDRMLALRVPAHAEVTVARVELRRLRTAGRP